MTKDEALALALEALEYIHEGANNQGPHTGISWRCVAVKAEPAITAIKQARALDKKAENARELGLDYEPDYKVTVVDDHHPNGVPLEQWGRVAKQGEHMRQRIEDLISAMEYHVEQTRPVHSTTIALQAAREALKAMPTPLVCDCNQGQVCHVCDPITPPAPPAPVQEPVAWMYGCVGRGRMYAEELDDPAGWQPLYTTPPAAQRQWVGLTDEERMDILLNLNWDKKLSHMDTALTIEAKLKEKNNG